jgi:4'-phosphopantetheinyl transferase
MLDTFASADDRLRAKRSLRPGAARARLRARGLLRELAARYAGIDRADVYLATDLHGKPVLRPSRVEFSVSHSGALAVYAFARERSVGVDVEVASRTRRAIDATGVAARAFGDAEAARLRSLSPRAREREFTRRWVRHEALAKCAGVGIWDRAARPEPHDPAARRCATWLVDLPLTHEPFATAAIAVAGPPPSELRLLRWS